MKRIALITGATAGIGEATAEILAENGFKLILTGRRTERLEQLKAKLEKDTDCETVILPFDIRNKDATEKAFLSLPEEWKNIDVLINNAGLAAGLATIEEGDVDDWERMIDTNIKGTSVHYSSGYSDYGKTLQWPYC